MKLIASHVKPCSYTLDTTPYTGIRRSIYIYISNCLRPAPPPLQRPFPAPFWGTLGAPGRHFGHFGHPGPPLWGTFGTPGLHFGHFVHPGRPFGAPVRKRCELPPGPGAQNMCLDCTGVAGLHVRPAPKKSCRAKRVMGLGGPKELLFWGVPPSPPPTTNSTHQSR